MSLNNHYHTFDNSGHYLLLSSCPAEDYKFLGEKYKHYESLKGVGKRFGELVNKADQEWFKTGKISQASRIQFETLKQDFTQAKNSLLGLKFVPRRSDETDQNASAEIARFERDDLADLDKFINGNGWKTTPLQIKSQMDRCNFDFRTNPNGFYECKPLYDEVKTEAFRLYYLWNTIDLAKLKDGKISKEQTKSLYEHTEVLKSVIATYSQCLEKFYPAIAHPHWREIAFELSWYLDGSRDLLHLIGQPEKVVEEQKEESKEARDLTPADVVKQTKTEALKKELLENHLEVLQEQVAENLNKNNPEAVLKPIEKFADELAKLALAQDLIDLRKRLLESSLPEDMIEEIMNNWSIIGKDVQSGEKALTEKRKEKIIENAKKSWNRVKLADLDKTLSKLEIEVGTLGHEEVVKKKYPELFEGLQDKTKAGVDQRQKRYNHIINTSIVRRLLTEQAAFTAKPLEVIVVKNLGYKQEAFLDNKKAHAAVTSILDEMLKKTQLLQSKSGKQLREEIEKKGLEQRLLIAGVHQKNLTFVLMVIEETAKLDQELRKFFKGFTVLNQEELQLPQFAQCMRSKENATKNSCIEHCVKTFLGKAKNLNSQEGIQTLLRDEFGRNFKEAMANKLMKRLGVKLVKEKQWYQNYGATLAVELVQGLDDPQTVFLEGVCWAICTRIKKTIIRNPAFNHNQLQADKVLPIDRYNQAYYSTNFSNRKKNSFYDQHGKMIREYRSFALSIDRKQLNMEAVKSNLNRQLLKNLLDHRTFSQGIFSMGIFSKNGGHATFIQIDPENEHYRIFDPNKGMQTFTKRAEQTVEQMVRVVGNAYVDLLDKSYQSYTALQATYPIFEWDDQA